MCYAQKLQNKFKNKSFGEYLELYTMEDILTSLTVDIDYLISIL